MSLSRCGNGHIFSARKHGNVCPYCNSLSGDPAAKSGSGLRKGGKRVQTVSHTNDDNAKTMAYWDENEGIEPVVGWLVCIEGAQRGQDYKIRSEKNFIGRSEEMHVCIAGDNSISRRSHAVISYNPLKRNFYLISGDGAGLVYKNNEAVLIPEELHAYDVIQMGKSKFIFLPLCGIHFDWVNEDQAPEEPREE